MIGPQPHTPPKGVNFTGQMALGQSTNGRITGKMAQSVEIAALQEEHSDQEQQA